MAFKQDGVPDGGRGADSNKVDGKVAGKVAGKVDDKGDGKGDGKVAEVGELFRQHGPMVYRRAFRLLGRREDADEAMQEVFIRVMRGASSFEGRSGVTTWLYQITTHYCLNLLRDRARRRQLLQENPLSGDEPSGPAASELVHLRRLLAEADEQQARAAIYVYLDGMSHEEAAVVLGVSKRTVGNLIDRFLAWANQRSEHAGTKK